MKYEPSRQELFALLDVDYETGALTWRPRDLDLFGTAAEGKRWNTRYAGTPALASHSGKGYKKGKLLGGFYSAHRVIFAMAHGYWPNEIDHRNRDKLDNSLSNLREVTPSQNRLNTGVRADNTSGFTGVFPNKKRWQAKTSVDGKAVCLGTFDTKEQASAAHTAYTQTLYQEI